MHRSSYLKMTAFRDCYLGGPSDSNGGRSTPLRVLDLGARAALDHRSYRDLFSSTSFVYVGLDMEAGPNVDIVVSDPHDWTEIDSDAFDAVISGQTIEHDPEFWVTIAEIARVLRPGGLCCLIAPSTGPLHRYPLDCWRFYADAGPAMMSWAGLQHVETHVETKRWGKGAGIEWGDMMVVGRKPELDPSARAAFDARLATIVALGADRSDRSLANSEPGPAAQRFESMAKVPVFRRCPYAIRSFVIRVLNAPSTLQPMFDRARNFCRRQLRR